MQAWLRTLAQRSANFGFLLDLEPVLLSYEAAAESPVFDDPHTSPVKARQFAEAAAGALVTRMGLRPAGDRQVDRLWAAYVALGEARAGGGHDVAELVSILRYELGMDTALAPYSSRVEENLTAWIARQEQQGARFTVDQHRWLDRIAEVVVTSLGCSTQVLDETPFIQRGGADGFLDAFGEDRAEAVLAELNAELPA